MVEVLILGAVALRHGDQIVVAPSARTRALVGALALANGRGLSSADLIDAVWPDAEPGGHRSALSVTVHRARRWLTETSGGSVGIDSTITGYALAGDVDADRFGRLVTAAELVPTGARAGLLAEAIALWRGDEPLAGLALGAVLEARVEALHRARLGAVARYGAALLALGRPQEAVAALTPLAGSHPLDEQVQAVLIDALASCGRKAEALDRYERVRARLAEEFGVDPGPELGAALLRVLRRESGPSWTPQAVPAQLPPDLAAFTGRAAELAELEEVRHAVAGGSVVIATLDGIGGVGKTALAVRWARRIVADFPDGQLYVDLRGHARAAPVEPGQALGRFLRGLGVPPERVPVDVIEAAALYRSLLSGRRVLVLLDNARDAEQVRPLLPASPGCLALVTSRDRLDGLVAHEGAARVDLDSLDPGEALALLAAALGRRRVDAEPEAAAELIELCDRLPLALRVTAAQLAAAPHRRLADQVAALREDRLGELSMLDDPRSSVRAALELSYERLAPADRRLFRLLGPVPGTGLGVPAAAALAATTESETRQAMRRLVAAHLVREHGDRYSMPNLIRRYARELAESAGDGDVGLRRLATWYLRGCFWCSRLMEWRRLTDVALACAPAAVPAEKGW